MADTKISNLPAVAAPAGGDEFACNQGGTTKKETKTQITAATDAALAADVAALAAHVATTTAPIHGSSAAAGANTLAHRNAAGDLAATDFNAVAGTAANPSHTFTADPDTGLYRFAVNELGIATAGVHRAHWNATGAVILNDAAASSKMTGPGTTIQQGAFDDEAVAVQSTDVAHGITDFADTDTYYLVAKHEPTSGGAAIRGLKDADGFAGGAVLLSGLLGMNADTDKTAVGRAIVEVAGYIKSGTGIGNTNADGNVFGIRTMRGGAVVTLLLVDEDADLHVLNDIVVAGVVDTIDVANHTHTAAAGMGPQIPTGGIANDAVTDAKLRNSAATSVIGRAGAGVGDPADIVAGVNDRLLAQTAGTVAFQQLTVGMVPGGIITATEIANRTRRFFAPCVGGWNTSTGTALNRSNSHGWTLVDANICQGYGSYLVPDDFGAAMTVTPVVVPGATGNIRSSHFISYGQCGENYSIHSNSQGTTTIAVTLTENNCIQQLAMANAAAGDIVNLTFIRTGNDALDTINADAYFSGFIIEYTADS